MGVLISSDFLNEFVDLCIGVPRGARIARMNSRGFEAAVSTKKPLIAATSP